MYNSFPTALTRCFGRDFHFNRHGVRVVALCPYFVQTPLLNDDFAQWSDDLEVRELIKEVSQNRQFHTPEETAQKLLNILDAQNGTVWMIRPEQQQPFFIPDFEAPTFPKVDQSQGN